MNLKFPFSVMVSFLSLAICITSASVRAEEDAEELYKKMVRSTVFIYTPEKGGHSEGSGFLIDADKKIMITNYHVVGNSKFCFAMFPAYQKDGTILTDKKKYLERIQQGDAIKGTILYIDKSRDLAIVQLAKLAPGATPIPLAAKSVTPGATVWNIGSPGAVEQVFGITEGKVRAIGNEEFAIGGAGLEPFTVKAKMVTTTNPTNPGDSGGPLFNKKGELVAVTQSGAKNAQLVNQFVDVSEVRNFLDEKKIVIRSREPSEVVTPKGTKEPKTDTPTPTDVSADEKAAASLLSTAKAYSKSEDLREKYVIKLKEIITKHPNTAAAKDAKRLLDGLK